MMQLSRRTLVATTMLAVLGPALPAMASEQERLVERAKLALEEFLVGQRHQFPARLMMSSTVRRRSASCCVPTLADLSSS
mgnify:CR=1 FL=1